MTKNPQGIAIVSGGLDSTVLAYYLAKDNQLNAIVSVNYAQRHAFSEMQCSAVTAQKLGVPRIALNLTSLGLVLNNSALTGNIAVPEGHYTDESMRLTVVPNRNMVLLAVATSIAVNRGCAFVAYGAHAGDHAIYPDCRPEFADAMATAMQLCDTAPPALMRPFLNMTKAQIVQLGHRLGVPFGDTYSCYNGEVAACGKCGTCVERLEAFAQNGLVDPIAYKDREAWRKYV